MFADHVFVRPRVDHRMTGRQSIHTVVGALAVGVLAGYFPLFAQGGDGHGLCRVVVRDKQCGWPVPMVELRTTNQVRFVSDNAGVIALNLPDRLNLETIRRTTKEIEERYARARLRTGDILVSIRGTVGRVCLVPKELDGANITQDTARLTLQDCLSREFVVLCLRAPVTQDRMRRCAKGVAVRGINIGDVRALQLPVPPLAEQHRIVAKVDELTDRCDRLEAQLTTAQTESRCLLEALLHLTLAAVA